MDDVVFEDLSAALRIVPVLGPEPPRGSGARGANLRRLLEPPARRAGARPRSCRWPTRRAPRTRSSAEGADDAHAEDLEAIRILGGLARFGADMDATRLPMEAGLTRPPSRSRRAATPGRRSCSGRRHAATCSAGSCSSTLPPGAGPGDDRSPPAGTRSGS